MVLKVVYRKSQEEWEKSAERRKVEKDFAALCDEYVPESERSHNQKYKSFKVKREDKNLTRKIIESTKNFGD